MACRYGGLSFFDKKERRFTTFKAFTYEGSLSNNDVLAVYKDSKNRLWVGTSYGLNWINEKDAVKKEPVFQKLTTTNGLPNNTIHAISEDSMGNIWVSTNKGLAKIQPADLKVSHYQLPDGLQSNEFCDGAVWKNEGGYLFFGGTYGFNYFLPQNIRKTDRIPGLLVSGIIIGGKNENNFTVVNPGDNHPLSFSMKREDNFFEINAVTLSYLNAEKCEYAYYLEGYDKTWHYPGVPGKITYSNLLPGHYTLMIKWSNGEGNWTIPSPLAKLEVKQYPWLTLPALLVYTLLLLTVGFFFYRYRKNKLEIKHQLDMEHRMRTREEQIHEDRIGFFTNIAHELQTPLTLIMGSTERFLEKNNPMGKQQEKPYFLSLIHQQASRLTYLLQQLLEFRKAESDMLNNQYSYLDLSESLNNLATPFITLSEKNGMDYQRNIAPEITGWMDKDKLEKILFNLLSNAFKHSGKNEKVIFSAIENKATGELEITVANSGSEIPESQLHRIFDKFYRAGPGTVYDEKFGTGIGLAFTRQLVTLLKGKIEVTSEKGWITFIVSLPLIAEGLETTDPEKNAPVTLKPSYLYQSIIAYPKTDPPVSAMENNKQAFVEKLDTGNRKNILVVEDDVDLRFLLKDILKDNYNVFEAENGKVAVDLILKMIPDLIISDVMMPGMDGLELCNRVKNAPVTCHIPFIILSVKGSMEQKTEGYEVGADAYIAKPFRIDHLQVRVRKLLEYRDKLKDFFKNDRSATLSIEPELMDSDREFLNKLVSIIEKHLDDEELNAQLIEKELTLSKMQLYRKLKTLTGMTPAEFIRHFRLKQAAHLLATTHLTVSEIFYSTGFNNQSYFYREFKKRYLCAPNDYRAQQTVEKG
jgi:signal transduction histidine kinase/DNA-binding response OmpR family regulator